MFNWFRRKVEEERAGRQDLIVEAADQANAFAIQVCAAVRGVKREMLEDPFVVGLIAMYSAITLKVLMNGKAPNSMIESAMIEGVVRTFAGQGASRVDAISALMRHKHHPTYARAVQAVSLVLSAKYERKDMAFDASIVEARQYVRNLPEVVRLSFGITEPEQVAYEVARRHVIDVLKASA